MQSFEFVPVLGRRTQFDGLPDALRGEFVDDLFQNASPAIALLVGPEGTESAHRKGITGIG